MSLHGIYLGLTSAYILWLWYWGAVDKVGEGMVGYPVVALALAWYERWCDGPKERKPDYWDINYQMMWDDKAKAYQLVGIQSTPRFYGDQPTPPLSKATAAEQGIINGCDCCSDLSPILEVTLEPIPAKGEPWPG